MKLQHNKCLKSSVTWNNYFFIDSLDGHLHDLNITLYHITHLMSYVAILCTFCPRDPKRPQVSPPNDTFSCAHCGILCDTAAERHAMHVKMSNLYFKLVKAFRICARQIQITWLSSSKKRSFCFSSFPTHCRLHGPSGRHGPIRSSFTTRQINITNR